MLMLITLILCSASIFLKLHMGVFFNSLAVSTLHLSTFLFCEFRYKLKMSLSVKNKSGDTRYTI